MLREHQEILSAALLVTDMAAIGVLSGLGLLTSPVTGPAPRVWLLVVLAVSAWPILAWKWQVYHSRRLKGLPEELFLLFKATVSTFGLATLGTVVLSKGALDGTRLLAVLLGVPPALFLIRLPFRLFLKKIRTHGKNLRYVVIAGRGEETKEILSYLKGNPHFGLHLLGCFGFAGEKDISLGEVPLLGMVKDLPAFLEKNVVDEILISPARDVTLAQVNQVLQAVEEFGIPIRLLPKTFSPRHAKASISWFGTIPTMAWCMGPAESFSMVFKRALDMVVSALLLVLLSPVFILAALAIKLTSKGPVFFSQVRCGLHGRPFKVFKFRTMVTDAEKKKRHLLKMNEWDGPVFKMKNDPRITPVGRFLRKFSIDELPQLYNVLRGEMSLVGPRPPLPDEVANYDRKHLRRLSVRPGITCIWQVKARDGRDFKKWVEMDLEYIDNWSLGLDLKLLLLTISAVIRGTGA
ncbi:MAG TPA: sugar transferase [Planctomycetes bacterium]|nr:sugar transferase [Planctomycetota bacterium]